MSGPISPSFNSAAHENRLDGALLFLKKTFRNRNAKEQLIIPGQADEDHPEIFLLLGPGGRRVKKYERWDKQEE